MSLYVTPYGRRYMRQMMRNLRDMDARWSAPEAELVFPMDVKVEDDAYILTALLPGIKPEDVNIQVVNDIVSLQGEFKNEREENGTYLLEERPSGRFYRTLTLPDRVDFSKAEANMDNGVLTLRLPKAEEVRPKSIKVNVK